MATITPANVSPPGELIREEVEGRGWTLSDLAKIMGRPLQLVSEIVNAKRAITATTAKELGEAFGTGPEVWINLQKMWELSQAKGPNGVVRQRAEIYEMAPVREMVRRKWIKKTDSPDALASELARHFRVASLSDVPQLTAAARAAISNEKSMLTPEQWAWCCRAQSVSSLVHAKRYRESALRECIEELRRLTAEPEEIRLVPRLLAEAGVRLVIVEHLQHTRIDGAALREQGDQPVVALSLRYGQIDKFWHNLMHELSHVLRGDGVCADIDMHTCGKNADEIEDRANREAAHWLIPREEMESFIRRTTMAYTARKIINFSKRIGVHPAIVTGQLKFLGEMKWAQLAKLHVDVRDLVRQASISDGWGEPAPLGD